MAPHRRRSLSYVRMNKLHQNRQCRHHCGCVRLGPVFLCCCSYRRRSCSPPPWKMRQTYRITACSATRSFRRGAGTSSWHHNLLQPFSTFSGSADRRLLETLRAPSTTAEACQQLHSPPPSSHTPTRCSSRLLKHVLACLGRPASECSCCPGLLALNGQLARSTITSSRLVLGTHTIYRRLVFGTLNDFLSHVRAL
jgi:hypothetical protein